MWTANETQKLFMETLKGNGSPMTLKEVSDKVGQEIKTGSINTLVAKGLVVCNKNAREIVCECCGHKRKVSTYELVEA